MYTTSTSLYVCIYIIVFSTLHCKLLLFYILSLVSLYISLVHMFGCQNKLVIIIIIFAMLGL